MFSTARRPVIPELPRWRSRGMGIASSLVASLLLSQGCASFVATKGPPKAHATLPDFECSTSYALPIIDTAVGAALGGLAVTGLVHASRNGGIEQDAKLPLATLGIWTTVAAASAVYGYWKVGACRDAKDDLGRRTAASARTAPLPPPDRTLPQLARPSLVGQPGQRDTLR